MRGRRWLLPVLVAVSTSCASARRALTPPVVARSEQPAALQVPYISQSELLCGGAAIAMVERWWGRRGVYAEDFSHLVKKSEGGIRTTDMEQVVRARGWQTTAMASTAAVLRQSIADSVPVIALIEVGRRRYHYVVVLAWTDSTVTYHDPAVSPARTVAVAEFSRQWNGARQWAMFVRPAADGAIATTARQTPSSTMPIDSLPCRPLLDQAADAVAGDRLTDADRLLSAAMDACPAEPIVMRELAGLRFRQRNHVEAARLAHGYTQRVPGDSLGWMLLASSRYLAGDAVGALTAWNTVGRPAIDLLRIDGSSRVRFRTLADAMHLSPGATLTPTDLGLAQRRIGDVPALALSRVSYVAVAGGAVEVRAAVVERPLADPLVQTLVTEGFRAAIVREVILSSSTPLGAGELWTVHWRWRHADPRLALRLEIPVRLGVPATMRFERSWDTYRFAAAGTGELEDTRGASSVSLGGWLRPDVELRTAARFERWSAQGNFVALAAGAGWHTADDRVSLLADVEHAVPLSGNESYDRITSRVTWTLPADRWANTWSMRLGADWSTTSTPRGLWPIAAGGLLRAIPLRAHPLIVNGTLPASRTGPRVVHGGLAGDRHVVTRGRLSFGAGVFLDGANVLSPADGSDEARLYLDAGAGLRLSLAGVKWAAVRVDLARGLATDRRWGLTAAYLQTLPMRLSRVR